MRLYNKEVVTASIYKYSGQFYISQQIDDKNPNFITVVFESKDHNKITEDIPRATASKNLLPFAYGNAVKTSSLLC